MKKSLGLTKILSCIILMLAVLCGGMCVIGGLTSKTVSADDAEVVHSGAMPLMHEVVIYVNDEEVKTIYVTDGGKLNAEELIDMVTFEPGGYLTDADVAKIRDITWYYKDAGTAVFDFNSVIDTKFIDEHSQGGVLRINGKYAQVSGEEDLTYIWILVIGGAIIILIFVVATIFRNNTTKMSLKNKYVMSPKLKQQVEEIKEIEKRKEQYSVLNDDD